jgi:hypothetical protein
MSAHGNVGTLTTVAPVVGVTVTLVPPVTLLTPVAGAPVMSAHGNVGTLTTGFSAVPVTVTLVPAPTLSTVPPPPALAGCCVVAFVCEPPARREDWLNFCPKLTVEGIRGRAGR